MSVAEKIESVEPELLKPAAYHQLLERLVETGGTYGKTSNVAAYKLVGLKLVTQDRAGNDEVTKNVEFKEQLYMVFDLKDWPTEYGRKLAVKDVAFRWASRVIGEEDLNNPDFKGPGMWTNRESGFLGDYTKQPNDDGSAPDLYIPNPEGRRQCLDITQGVKIPTSWGEPFFVDKGGCLAIRSRDVPALREALQKIREGKATPEEVLYVKNEKGNAIAAFDVYGMMPGYLKNNYGLIHNNNSTTASFKLVQKETLQMPEKIEENRTSWSLDQIIEEATRTHEDTLRDAEGEAGPRLYGILSIAHTWLAIKQAVQHIKDSGIKVDPFVPRKDFLKESIHEWLEDIGGPRSAGNKVLFAQTQEGVFKSVGFVSQKTREEFEKVLEGHGIKSVYTKQNIGRNGGNLIYEKSVLDALNEKGEIPLAFNSNQYNVSMKSVYGLNPKEIHAIDDIFSNRGIVKTEDSESSIKVNKNTGTAYVPYSFVRKLGRFGGDDVVFCGRAPESASKIDENQERVPGRGALERISRFLRLER